MQWLVTFLVGAIAISGAIGWWFPRSRAWKHIDLFYYPLGAIGVALLFASAENQRSIVNSVQALEAARSKLKSIEASPPSTSAPGDLGELLNIGFGILETIPARGAACDGSKSVEPSCEVARSLAAPVAAYLKENTAQRAFDPLKRLLSACRDAEQLLKDLPKSGALSGTVGSELLSHYQAGIGQNFSPLAFESARAHILAFKPLVMTTAEKAKSALGPESEVTRRVIERYASEADYGTALLHSFLPCFMAPARRLEWFHWYTAKQNSEEEIGQLDQGIRRLRDGNPEHPWLAFIILAVWPYILVSALALKFAKGVAAVRA